MMAVRGITFDLDDTLWSGKETLTKAGHVFHAHLAATYPRITADVFQRTWTQVMTSTSSRDFTVLRETTLRQCASQTNYDPDTVVETAMEEFLAARSSPDLFAGVESLLASLEARQLKLGVITNSNCDATYLPPTLQRVFQSCWVAPSTAQGQSKPHRALFDQALTRLALGAAAVVHIGDDYTCDVVGAKEAGLRAIWVTSAAVDAAAYPHADAIVPDVDAAVRVVLDWDASARN
ncbi:Aste57867_12273 [Aphanomyces stellatus]|uniref:Aste57867_12273 protein n=1 Tax=Aphanomyces stellatus TaxID=120398 RepID=A0A485KWH9_9STRA|nr:hypothetical protein As57867_012228 [Aphanomyces stellatus]VFT89126.1 Aste57867_12273 [Aphanomyces stellatus]